VTVNLFKGGSWKSWLEASSVLAAAVYALGWIFVARLFSRFSVTPEEAGFSFGYLLIRVVFLVVVVAAVITLVVWGLNRLATRAGARRFSLRTGTDRDRDRDLAWQVVGVFAVIFALWSIFENPSGRSGRSWVIALVATLVTYVFVIRSRRLRNETDEERRAVLVPAGDEDDDMSNSRPAISFSLQSLFRFLAYGSAIVAIVALLAGAYFTADRYADRIQDGKELRAPVVPGIAGLNIQRVQATTTDDRPISPALGRSRCVHLLGSSGGTVVLYDHGNPDKSDDGVVVRVPEGRVSLEDPCD
jgi:hypothetical protein